MPSKLVKALVHPVLILHYGLGKLAPYVKDRTYVKWKYRLNMGERCDLEHPKTFQEKLGIQFQDSFYPNAITVKEVIDFMIGLYGSKINHDELIAMLNIFGINEYYKKRVSKLSGGQQQRLNALLAIIHKPTVLFLDELSTGLDITIRTNIKRFIKHYAIENNITLILVSHDTDEIAYLADEIAVLKNGKIVYFDTKDNIVQEYGNIEKFLIPYL